MENDVVDPERLNWLVVFETKRDRVNSQSIARQLDGVREHTDSTYGWRGSSTDGKHKSEGAISWALRIEQGLYPLLE